MMETEMAEPRRFMGDDIEHPGWEFDGMKFGYLVHPVAAREACPFCRVLDSIED